ncbi:hypothetical protein GCM10018966_001670 [Streptomyces yanii]
MAVVGPATPPPMIRALVIDVDFLNHPVVQLTFPDLGNRDSGIPRMARRGAKRIPTLTRERGPGSPYPPLFTVAGAVARTPPGQGCSRTPRPAMNEGKP